MDKLLKEMEAKGLAQTGSSWIKRAIIEKPAVISLALVSSNLLVYDRIDQMVTYISRAN